MICIATGVLPFGSIFIEMYFVFTSFWNYKFYYVYGANLKLTKFECCVYVFVSCGPMCLSRARAWLMPCVRSKSVIARAPSWPCTVALAWFRPASHHVLLPLQASCSSCT